MGTVSNALAPQDVARSAEQNKVIGIVNDTLARNSLPTYTQLEENISMLGVACMESVQTGKRLVMRLSQLEAENKKLKAK